LLDRIQRLRELLPGEGADALLVSRPENIFYLTGFKGSSGSVLVTADDVCLFTDFRYEEQAKNQAPHSRLVISRFHTGSFKRYRWNSHIQNMGC
jgi:Xaa-Pro aminopeptidase